MMPVARYQMPDGRIARFEVPDGTTPEQAQSMIMQMMQPQSIDKDAGYNKAAQEDSVFTNAAAAAGGMMKAPYVGVRQMLGMSKPGEVEEWKRSMDALTKTGGGIAGSIVGGAALPVAAATMLPGSATVLGAGATGAVIGALDPVTDGQTRLGNATKGAIFNAALPAAVATGTAVKRGIIDPFRKGGQEQIAGRVLGRFASNADDAVNAARAPVEYVPGSKPTLAEATLDPGLATLQETLRSADAQTVKAALVNRANQNSAARLNVLRDMAGTDGKREFFGAARAKAADDLYERAFSVPIQIENLSAAQRGEITKLLNMPAITKAMSQAKENAANFGMKLDAEGSIAGLHQTKLALDDQIDRLYAGASSAAERNKAKAIEAARDRLVTFMQAMSPDYGVARETYKEMSKPINGMDVAKRLYDKSTSALMEGSEAQRLYPNAFGKNLADEVSLVKQGSGRNGSLRSVLPDDEIKSLNAIKKDLQRQVRAQELAKVNGSPTSQYLVGQDILRQIIGPVGMPKGAAEASIVQNFVNRPISAVYGVPEQAVRGLLAESMVNPQLAASLLGRAQTPLLGDRVMNSAPYRLLAPATGAGLLGLTQQ